MHRDCGSKDDRACSDPKNRRRGARLVEEIDAENVDRYLEDREHARFHNGDGVEEGGDRRRRDHRVWQPWMDWHQRGLTNAERVKRHKDAGDRARLVDMARKKAADREIGRARNRIGPHDRRQEETDGGREQDAEINAATIARLVIALVRDEREGRQRQHFIEDEEREQVRRIGDADRRRDGDGEAHEEASLMLLVVPAHIADRIERINDPEPRRDHGEHRA